MLEKTDLNKVKNMAKTLLHTDLHIDKDFDFFCHHPFFSQTVFYDNKSSEILNLTNNEHLGRAMMILEEQIDKIQDYAHFAMLIQKPYLPAFFKFTNEFLEKKDYAEFLQHLWVTTEFPNHDANVSVGEFKKYFQKADKKLLMGEDYEEFQKLPDKITVYRGTYLKATTNALSWTTDIKKAEWFAQRFGGSGKVHEATIDKENIFAFFKSCEESEIVLDYKKLENMKVIKEIDKENNIEL